MARTHDRLLRLNVKTGPCFARVNGLMLVRFVRSENQVAPFDARKYPKDLIVYRSVSRYMHVRKKRRARLFFSRAGHWAHMQAKCIDTICIERLLAPIFC